MVKFSGVQTSPMLLTMQCTQDWLVISVTIFPKDPNNGCNPIHKHRKLVNEIRERKSLLWKSLIKKYGEVY